jgi:hypothetical protein
MKIVNMRSFAVIALFAASLLTIGCGSGSTPAGIPVGAGTGGGGTAANVQSISVNGGPLVNSTTTPSIYPNGIFTSVTICVPGTATCQVIPDVLVDTGSEGLRLLSSEVTISLPTLSSSAGNLMNCTSFVGLSYIWGPVAVADVKLGTAEVATSTPLQLISTDTNVPSACSIGETGGDDDTVLLLGSNGILGVGPEPNDCGPACDPNFVTVAPTGDPYYVCTSSTCTATLVAQSSQVTNPVIYFADNNGVIMELPAPASEATATLNGSLIFGINTESNNQLPSTANLFTLDSFDDFTVDFASCVSSLGTPGVCDESFIDSGSNAYFFPDSSIPNCTDFPSFFCPVGLTALSATNVDPNFPTVTNVVNFSVDNTDNLFNSGTGTDAVFTTLGGAGSAASFDWGLPFFYGKNVFTAIDGQVVPNVGTFPFWAY